MIADVYGVTTDANMWDMQVGLERMMAAAIPAMAGADHLSGIGGAWEAAGSYEMLVIDDDIYENVFRMVRGIEVDEGRLALDVIDKVGHMGNFLSVMHTMDYLRKGEMINSKIMDKRTWERAKKEGPKPMRETAKEAVKKILKEHQPMPLDKDVERDLDAIVKENEKKTLGKS
jgi:trimethylamine--corrinoid protein Co-methyltransferase